MDNREIRIQSEGRIAFSHALALLWHNAPGSQVTHWCEVKPNGIELDPYKSYYGDSLVRGYKANTLVLFWHKPEVWNYEKVQVRKMDLRRAEIVVWDWLNKQPRETWDERLSDSDFDGSLGQGFLAFSEQWGHVGGCGYAFASFRPICSWYGK